MDDWWLMITTDDRHEMQLFPFMRLPGVKAWGLVGLELRRPYFVVNYGCKEKLTWVTQTALLWQEEDLRAFCDEANGKSAMKIYQIGMMVPPKSTDFDLWDWHVLREIWSCEIKDCTERVMLYVSIEGDRLFSPHVVVDKQKLNFTEVIFQMVDVSAEMNATVPA
jgi:hypothetical protein